MSTETFPPARAARQIGVPPNTLRSWCKVYGEFLSEGANPPVGVERKLTSGDVETLRAVSQLRANDIPPEDIIARLRENPSAATTALPQPPESSTIAPADVPDVPPVSTALAPAHDAIQAFLARNDVTDKLESIDRRLERVESRSNLVAAVVVAVVVAFAAGGALVWLIMTR